MTQRQNQGLSFLLHAPAKAGKSSLADSGPVPRLVMDIEGSAYWTPSRKVYWNPMAEPVPVPDGTWDTCLALCKDVRTMERCYQILTSGQHPFKSLSVDSVTEMQQRVIDERVGVKKVERDEWGHLLRLVSSTVRGYRDLLTHPTNPLWSVTFVAGTSIRDGKWRPLVQGQVGNFLPYYVDVLGYVVANQDETRDLLIGPQMNYETGERLGEQAAPGDAARLPGQGARVDDRGHAPPGADRELTVDKKNPPTRPIEVDDTEPIIRIPESEPVWLLQQVQDQARRYLEAMYGTNVWFRAPETFDNLVERWIWSVASGRNGVRVGEASIDTIEQKVREQRK